MSPVILGVDPGSRYTGFGVVQGEGNQLLHLASGSINPGSRPPLESRLCQIFDGLVGPNPAASPPGHRPGRDLPGHQCPQRLRPGPGAGRGAAPRGPVQVPIFHYSPLVVKKAVVGYGRASKSQVQLMVKQLLGVEAENEHAADALAVGMCHLFHSRWPGASP